jgi:hypothetical protein
MKYFAYGSNMSLARIRARIASARPLGAALLTGHVLKFHKRGDDGSGKGNAFETGREADRVYGVLFEITDGGKSVLDRFEGLGQGYLDKTVSVDLLSGETGIRAVTYYATRIDEALRPYTWYLDFVVHGARENGLPEEYVAWLAHTEAVADPDARRDSANRAILGE